MMQSTTNKSVAIILVNWNGCEDTLECLESVFRLNYPNFRVIVCDNASSDGSLDKIELWAQGLVEVKPASMNHTGIFSGRARVASIPFVRYGREAAESTVSGEDDPSLVLFDTGGNLGFAGGNNVGIRYALARTQAEFVWLLNTDTIVDPDALTRLVERAEQNPLIGMVGSSLIYYWDPGKVQVMAGASMHPRTTRMVLLGTDQPVDTIPGDPTQIETQMAFVTGASMLVSRAFIERVGLMCEDYFLYYEEIDWALRGKSLFQLGYAPRSHVYHKVGGSSRRVASLASLRYLYRNRLRFVARFLPSRFTSTVLNLTFDMLRAALKGRYGQSLAIGGALIKAHRLYREGSEGPINHTR
jgi:GT2 family glycosyltransferase